MAVQQANGGGPPDRNEGDHRPLFRSEMLYTIGGEVNFGWRHKNQRFQEIPHFAGEEQTLKKQKDP